MQEGKKTHLWPIIPIIVFVIMFSITAYFLFTPTSLNEEERKNIKQNGTFLPGISVNGIDLSGMTFTQAKEALKTVEEAHSNLICVNATCLGKTYSFTKEDVSITYNTEEVLLNALTFATEGNYFSKLSEKNQLKKEGSSFSISCTVDPSPALTHADALPKALNSNPKNAGVSFDAQTNCFSYQKEEAGITIDLSRFKELLSSALKEQKPITIEIPYSSIPAKITQESLKKSIVKRATFETSFSKSPYNDENRVKNIKKCVTIINKSEKTTLMPQDTLSLNRILGDRNEETGWALAPGYTGGKTIDQPGGGVCQVSTTLYCAALASDLEIVSRTNHSIPVGYIQLGLDATISTGGPDLVIKNNTDSPIYLSCRVTEKNSLIFDIYGAPFSGFDHIALSSQKIKSIQPKEEENIIIDLSKPINYREILVKRRTGSLWNAYKNYYSGKKLIKREKILSSTYKAFAGERIIGPKSG